jgi:NAD(P)-dependent dehydrogenase (short-subunit alcohol dehydrogenase family)
MNPSPFSLSGRLALITGAGRGIGQSCALALSQAGAATVLVSRTESQLQETAGQITDQGGTAHVIGGDIGSSAGVDTLVAALDNLALTPDILVNAAGISPVYKYAQDMDHAEWDQVIQTNLNGTYYLTQTLGSRMLTKNQGAIVTVTSVGGQRALPRLCAYGASKAALDQLTRTLAVEWAAKGVRVNAVAPAYIETAMTAGLQDNNHLRTRIETRTPMGRFGRPEEVAWAVVYLASEAASYITGQTLAVDGGWVSV